MSRVSISFNGPHPEDLDSPLGSEATNGFVAGERTRPQRRNRCARFAALAIALALISIPTAVHAYSYSCAPLKTIALSLCQEDACTDGFQVENLHVPHRNCETRPVVRDLTDEERANFRDIIQRFEQEAPNGIYQLLAYPDCLWHEWRNARCLAAATITRLSVGGNAQTLIQYRTEWLAKERQAHRAAMIRPWRTPILLSLLTLVSLVWPWLLVALKASLRRYVIYMSVAAIPVQVFVFWLLEIYRHPQIAGMTVEWPQLALICESLILLFVPLQFGYLVWQKLRPAAQ